MKILLLLVVAAMISACSAPYQVSTDRPTVVNQPAYRLLPGDEVELVVFHQPQISGTYTISSAGTIGVSFVGELKLAGLTREDAQDSAKRLIQALYPTSEVSLKLVSGASSVISIIGEVRNPGNFSLRNGLSVPAAIGLAGGFTEGADTEHIQLIRPGVSGIVYEMAWQSVSAQTENTTFHLQPGDMLVVKKTTFQQITGYFGTLQPVFQSIIIILALAGN